MSDETAKLIKAIAYEISLHRGETPWSVDRGGVEGWERYKDLARNILGLPQIADALSQLDATRAERDAGADILRSLLRAEYESAGYGLHDCIDNDGQAYQSDYLDKQIKRAEAYLAALKHQGAET